MDIKFLIEEGSDVEGGEVFAEVNTEKDDVPDTEDKTESDSTQLTVVESEKNVNSTNELVSLQDIHSKKFEVAKKKISEFSKKSKIDYQVSLVETSGGLFGLGSHKVTGEELNENLLEINKAFVGVNKSISKTIDEFKDIYNALDALDKDYIQRILVNLELTRRVGEDALAASNSAKLASDDALLANEKAVKNQNELKNQHDALKLIVEKLKEKSEKIDELEKKIDSISKEKSSKKSVVAIILSVISFLFTLAMMIFIISPTGN